MGIIKWRKAFFCLFYVDFELIYFYIRGFTKVFEALVKWTSELGNPLAHT